MFLSLIQCLSCFRCVEHRCFTEYLFRRSFGLFDILGCFDKNRSSDQKSCQITVIVRSLLVPFITPCHLPFYEGGSAYVRFLCSGFDLIRSASMLWHLCFHRRKCFPRMKQENCKVQKHMPYYARKNWTWKQEKWKVRERAWIYGGRSLNEAVIFDH